MWTGSKYWAWRKLAYYIWASTRYDRFNWRRSRTATLKAVRSGHQEGELHVRQGWESLSIDICVQNTRREGNVCCKALPTERQYRHVDKFGGRAIGRGHRKLGAAESHSTCTATGQAETRRPTSSSRRVRIVGGPRRWARQRGCIRLVAHFSPVTIVAGGSLSQCILGDVRPPPWQLLTNIWIPPPQRRCGKRQQTPYHVEEWERCLFKDVLVHRRVSTISK
jgi:hypothetical protein